MTERIAAKFPLSLVLGLTMKAMRWRRQLDWLAWLVVALLGHGAQASSLPDPSPPPRQTGPSWKQRPVPRVVPQAPPEPSQPPAAEPTPPEHAPVPQPPASTPSPAPRVPPAPAENVRPRPSGPQRPARDGTSPGAAPAPTPTPPPPAAPEPAPSGYEDDVGRGALPQPPSDSAPEEPLPEPPAPPEVQEVPEPQPPAIAPRPAPKAPPTRTESTRERDTRRGRRHRPPIGRPATAVPVVAPKQGAEAPAADATPSASPTRPEPPPVGEAPKEPPLQNVAPALPVAPTTSGRNELPVPQNNTLSKWFEAVGPKDDSETFGHLIIRAARAALGRPYVATSIAAGEEILDVNVDAFQCVSFVESCLAVARCVELNDFTDACFAKQITTLRYRNGNMAGFVSRLNYFEDWLADNERRGHLTMISKLLGGTPVRRKTAYMTNHPHAFPPLRQRGVMRQIAAIEARLSRTPAIVVDAANIYAIEDKLEDGDIVAIATFRPDILVRHTGLIERDSHGVTHLVHASQTRHRVVVTKETLAAWVAHLPRHEGVLLARPLAPQKK